MGEVMTTKVCAACAVEKGITDFYRSNSHAGGVHSHCKVCDVLRGKAWRVANPEKHKSLARRCRNKNIEKERDRGREYKKKYPERVAAAVAQRRSAKLNATPGWASKFYIAEIYNLAKLRTKFLGVEHQVDHVIPLVHPLVCGLHTEANLRVVTKSFNQKKNNHFEVEPLSTVTANYGRHHRCADRLGALQEWVTEQGNVK